MEHREPHSVLLIHSSEALTLHEQCDACQSFFFILWFLRCREMQSCAPVSVLQVNRQK